MLKEIAEEEGSLGSEEGEGQKDNAQVPPPAARLAAGKPPLPPRASTKPPQVDLSASTSRLPLPAGLQSASVSIAPRLGAELPPRPHSAAPRVSADARMVPDAQLKEYASPSTSPRKSPKEPPAFSQKSPPRPEGADMATVVASSDAEGDEPPALGDEKALYVHSVTKGYVVTKEYAVDWDDERVVIPQRVARPLHDRVPLQRHVVPPGYDEAAGAGEGKQQQQQREQAARPASRQQQHTQQRPHSAVAIIAGASSAVTTPLPMTRPVSARGRLDTTEWSDPYNTADVVRVVASAAAVPVPPWLKPQGRAGPTDADRAAAAVAARRRPLSAQPPPQATSAPQRYGHGAMRRKSASEAMGVVLGVERRAAERAARRAVELAARPSATDGEVENPTGIAPEDSMMLRPPTPPRAAHALYAPFAVQAELDAMTASAQLAATAREAARAARWRAPRHHWRSSHEEASFHNHLERRARAMERRAPSSRGGSRPVSAYSTAHSAAYPMERLGSSSRSDALARWERQRRHHQPRPSSAPARSPERRTRRRSALTNRPPSAYTASTAASRSSSRPASAAPRRPHTGRARPASAFDNPRGPRITAGVGGRSGAASAPRVSTLSEVTDGVGSMLQLLRGR